MALVRMDKTLRTSLLCGKRQCVKVQENSENNINSTAASYQQRTCGPNSDADHVLIIKVFRCAILITPATTAAIPCPVDEYENDDDDDHGDDCDGNIARNKLSPLRKSVLMEEIHRDLMFLKAMW